MAKAAISTIPPHSITAAATAEVVSKIPKTTQTVGCEATDGATTCAMALTVTKNKAANIVHLLSNGKTIERPPSEKKLLLLFRGSIITFTFALTLLSAGARPNTPVAIAPTVEGTVPA
jgi:hypothetical protein